MITSPLHNSKFSEHYATTRSKEGLITIEWENIEYAVVSKSPKKSIFNKDEYSNKRILKNVKGRAESGQLLAIMGPTGCGKTSLLNVLAARMPRSNCINTELGGNIYINGVKRVDEDFRRISGYVLQDDKMYPHLTVYETLMLAAHFYLPNNVDDTQKGVLVMDIIHEMGLSKAKDTIIGDDKGRGVSGGERRRANIGAQLISDPAVLFLDEPTSGLDAFQANTVMASLKSLASNGRLVISVIHQPRSSIYVLFDKLLLLSEGRTMFLGDVEDARSFFLSTHNPCPVNYNPSDFFLDILSPDSRTVQSQTISENRIDMIGNAWDLKNGMLISKNKTVFNTSMILAVRPADEKNDLKRIIRNFKLLCWRSYTEQLRETAMVMIKIFFSCITGLIVGGLYYDLGNSQASIANRTGLLFVILFFQSNNGTMGVLNSFPREKTIVNRERSNRAYDAFSYFAAKFVVEIPLSAIPCAIFCCIVYFLSGLNPLNFGQFVGIVSLTELTAVSLGLLISALVPSVEVALAVGPPCFVVALLFGGFYINLRLGCFHLLMPYWVGLCVLRRTCRQII
jgi:ABC-type multidrug transport system ATPase subunit